VRLELTTRVTLPLRYNLLIVATTGFEPVFHDVNAALYPAEPSGLSYLTVEMAGFEPATF
jgi:hypothetical protein